MEHTSRSISQNVENGTYFKEAREWYIDNYLHPYTQRLYMTLVALSSLFFAFLIASVTLSGYWVQRYPFPVYFDDQIASFLHIKPLARGKESVNISVARYLITHYMQNREGYKPAELSEEAWQNKLNKVRALSSRSIFSTYINEVDPSQNPDSAVIRYKTHTKRHIEIEKVKFIENNVVPVAAKVYYKAVEITKNIETITHWVANITFSMSNLEVATDQKIKLQFTVTKYNVDQVQQS